MGAPNAPKSAGGVGALTARLVTFFIRAEIAMHLL
ncbi:unannotated protein [freshwater metagenome]|uniref:Unannotated protein n=1 Tax=freshwater metagenome TaxID=449393 RepID=A0A6J7B7K5_9ZZZZ